MRHRSGVVDALPALIVAMVGALSGYAGQQAPNGGKGSAPKGWVTPRTPDGRPDLQGIWNFRTATPLERPPEFANQEFLNEQDVAVTEQRAAGLLRANRPDGLLMNTPPWWLDYGTRVVGTRRSSLIVDPPDGRIPTMTAQGLRRREDLARAHAAVDGPESLNPWERCITRGFPTVMLPSAYNNYLQLVQTPGYVAIITEMIHEVRIVPLDGRAAPPRELRAWMGYSRGRWEGDTLVVETTNFSDQADFLGGGAQLRVVERFARMNADTIDYRFTVEDPTTWTRAWTVAVPLVKTEDRIYEYACSEANYSLKSMLGIARSDESAGARPR